MVDTQEMSLSLPLVCMCGDGGKTFTLLSYACLPDIALCVSISLVIIELITYLHFNVDDDDSDDDAAAARKSKKKLYVWMR